MRRQRADLCARPARCSARRSHWSVSVPPSSSDAGCRASLAGTTFAAFAMTEPESGSDAFALEATAERRADGSYVLNGHKAYITFAPDLRHGHRVRIDASGSRGAGASRPSSSTPRRRASTRSDLRSKMGMRTTPFGDIDFDDVVVPAIGAARSRGRRGRASSARCSTSSAATCSLRRSARCSANSTRRSPTPNTGSRAAARSLTTRPCRTGSSAMKERHERARLLPLPGGDGAGDGPRRDL